MGNPRTVLNDHSLLLNVCLMCVLTHHAIVEFGGPVKANQPESKKKADDDLYLARSEGIH